MATKCPHCGELVDAVDLEEVRDMPKGCECDPSDWRSDADINPVCGTWQNDGGGNCVFCEHLEECHQ